MNKDLIPVIIFKDNFKVALVIPMQPKTNKIAPPAHMMNEPKHIMLNVPPLNKYMKKTTKLAKEATPKAKSIT